MNRNTVCRGLLGLAVILSSTLTCLAAEVYQWTDENGVVHFGDQPPPSGDYATRDIQINSYNSVSVTDTAASAAASANKVVMYGTSWCTYCRKAKAYFHKNNIRYVEYDIEASAKARREYDKLGGRGVPVILVGDKRMNGFSVESFEKLYQ